MDVYIVESGSYEDAHISGVYSSLEKAMAAHPAGWKQSDDWWHNGLDMDEAMSISRYEVDAVRD